MRHDPTYLSGGGARWCNCTCGWSSPIFRTTAIGPQLAFGEHLLEIAPEDSQ